MPTIATPQGFADPILLDRPVTRATTTTASDRPRALGALRLLLGWIFLWAFLDKLFGLGMDTPASQAWVNGGSPAGGYLQFGLEGKMLQNTFVGMAGPVTDVLFMAALLGVGVGVLEDPITRSLPPGVMSWSGLPRKVRQPSLASAGRGIGRVIGRWMAFWASQLWTSSWPTGSPAEGISLAALKQLAARAQMLSVPPCCV